MLEVGKAGIRVDFGCLHVKIQTKWALVLLACLSKKSRIGMIRDVIQNAVFLVYFAGASK